MEKFIPEVRSEAVHHDPFAGPAIERCFPTTESQREVIASCEMGDDASCAYNESITLELNGDLDQALMSSALHQLVMRHDSLRATVTENGMQMIVGKEDPTTFEHVDLSPLGAEEREEKLKAIDEADMTRTFDLHKGPLFRHLLIRTAPGKHLLRLSAHHAVCDGWSLGIMMAEISTLYNAGKSGTTADLPEAPSFGDYSLATTDFADQPEHADVEKYWSDLFKAPLPRLDLPTDRPRPKRKTYTANRLDLAFPPELVRGLKETATRNGATFVTTLLTIFEVLLHKLTGANDLVVGLPAAGQSDMGQQHLVGHCVNLLALRSGLDGEIPFNEHLKKRRTAVLDAYDNQRYTFGTLVRKLNVPREPGRIPLCPVVFNVDMNMDDGVAFNGLTHRFTSNPRAFENFELFLNMTGNEDHLILEWSYNTDLFDEATVHDWMEQLARIAKGVITAPTATIAQLADNELPTDGEVKYPSAEWAGKTTPYPKTDIATLFDEVANAYPGNIAVELLDQRVTYKELQQRVHAASNGLVAMGVRPGEPVGLCMDRTVDLITATLAVLRAGGCYVPIDPSYPADRLGFMLTDTGMKILLTQPDLADSLPPHGAKTVLLNELSAASQDMPVTLPDAPGYIMYTSGSTGKPKGVVVPHRGIIRLVRDQDYMSFGPDLAFLHLSNISFDLSTLEIWGALLNGGRLVLQPQPKPTLQEISETIQRHKVTSLWFTVGLFNLMVDGQLEGLRGLRHILAGGDVLSVPHVRKALRALGPGVLINGYGPTENTTFTTCFKIDNEADITDSVPIGTALNNTTVYVLDEDLKQVPIGQKGELYTGGDGVALGYWNRDELTATQFIDDPWSTVPGAKLYRTGDIVRWRPDGTISFHGRADGQVKVRGFRVELGEVENALNDLDRVKDKVVMARQDGPGEKQLVCYIVPKEGKDLESAEATDRFIHDVREHLRGNLPGYMVPTAFVALEALPLTANAKIDRKALPAPSTRASIVKEKHVGPRNGTEKKLAEIWGEVLNIEGIGIHDNFFDLGGHSLLGIQMLAAVRSAFNVELSLPSIFEAPTLSALADVISGGARTARTPIVPVAKDGELEVSFGQQRMWMSSQFGRDAYDMSQAIRITGKLDVSGLARALDALVARHEPLRTTFEAMPEGHLVQRIHPPATRELPVEAVASLDDALARCQQESQQPYDLVSGPLFEPRLCRINDGDHVLLLRMHHIVGDEWSIDVLLRDLGSLYQGRALAPLQFSYADFAAWQRAHLTDDVVARELDFWRNQLAGAPTLLELPTDRPRPPVFSNNGALCERRLPPDLWRRIEVLGHEHQATPFMTLLAAFHVLLHRYAGATDISIGTPITNRDQPGTEDLVGFFINTLVLRTDLSGAPSFIDLLTRVRSVALGAFTHQDIPFERVVEAIAPERNPGHAPLFQVSFVHQPKQASPAPPGLAFEQMEIASSTAKFDLTLFTAPRPDGLACTLEYNTDLFDEATIDRMLEHFEILLEGIVAEPARSIDELSLLSASERQQLSEWNDGASLFPHESSMGQLFHEVVDAHSERIALEMGDMQISYDALKQRTLVIAGVLERAGVGPDDLVGLCSERCPDMVAAMLATLWRGAAFVPFDPTYPKERLDHMFKDTGVKVLLAQEHLLDMLPANPAKTLLLDHIGDEVPTADGPQGTALSPAYIMYTSGSTGQPKGVVVPHRAILRLVKEQNFLPFGPDLVFLQLSNISFDASTLELWGALLNGAKLVLQPQQKPTLQEIIGTIHQHKVTTVWFTAGVFNLLVDEYVEELRGLRHILTGGDVLSVPHVKRALRVLGPGVLINGYGPTENTTFTCCYPINDEHAIQARVPIGRPINNTTVHILNEAMRPVAIREQGELYAGGDGVALGYWQRPELTAAQFVDDPFSDTPGAKLYRTGDRATWLPDGTIDFLGRADGQVKVRGFRIELGEIESAISLLAEVKDNVVVVRNDMPGEKQLVAYVVPQALDGANGDASAQEHLIGMLREHLRNTLTAYMVPTAFVILDALPLNANGKVAKHALPVPEHRAQTMAGKHVAPRNATEARLAKLWGKLLNAPDPGVHDNFFDLGGQSMIGIRLLARVEDDFGTRLPLNSIFQAPTIAQFAELLQDEKDTIGLKNLAALQPAGDRIPFFCVHGDEANHHIMRYLGKDQPYYAFFHQGENGAPFEHKTVEEIATHYVKELMMVQPEGPYLLGGYSFGGIVAYEMASQLRDVGHDVPLLVMFDMSSPERFIETMGQGEEFYQPLKRTLMRWLVERDLRKGNIRSHKLRHFHIIDNYIKAIEAYHPQPYDGPVTVFKADHTGGPGDMGWSKLVTGPLDVRVLPGDHYSLIKDPGVKGLVKELSASIDRAVSKYAVEAV